MHHHCHIYKLSHTRVCPPPEKKTFEKKKTTTGAQEEETQQKKKWERTTKKRPEAKCDHVGCKMRQTMIGGTQYLNLSTKFGECTLVNSFLQFLQSVCCSSSGWRVLESLCYKRQYHSTPNSAQLPPWPSSVYISWHRQLPCFPVTFSTRKVWRNFASKAPKNI